MRSRFAARTFLAGFSAAVVTALSVLLPASSQATSDPTSGPASGPTDGLLPLACAAQTLTPTEYADRADAVFEGTVRETIVPEPNRRGRVTEPVTYVIEVTRLYKDDAVVTDTVRVQSSYYRASCGLGDLAPDSKYFFFVRARNDGFRTSSSLGSVSVTAATRGDVVAALGEGTATQPESPGAELALDRVDNSEPRPITRLVAPGAAMALVGLLGLALLGLTRLRR